MLENIRDKIQTVQQDLTTSLKGLTLADKIAPNNSRRNYPNRNRELKVDLNAGADVLHHYQQQWENLHKRSEENATEAEVAAKLIDNVNAITSRKHAVVNEFVTLVSTIPALNANVNCVSDDLAKLQRSISTVEEFLCKLEVEKKDEELKMVALNKKYEVAMYREKKNLEFEQSKVKHAMRHAERAKEYERIEKAKCRERELAFQAAFEDELNLYKKYGKIERTINVARPATPLEEIQVEPDEEDAKALNDFLSDPAEADK